LRISKFHNLNSPFVDTLPVTDASCWRTFQFKGRASGAAEIGRCGDRPRFASVPYGQAATLATSGRHLKRQRPPADRPPVGHLLFLAARLPFNKKSCVAHFLIPHLFLYRIKCILVNFDLVSGCFSAFAADHFGQTQRSFHFASFSARSATLGRRIDMFRTPSDSAFPPLSNGTGLLGFRSIGGRILIF
jgi:hypothetical protein